MPMSLAVKYRPKNFDDILGQVAAIKILRQQLNTGKLSNCYLFCGPSGDGKTTSARAFAAAINKGQGEPIEIDGASNNGVDAVRELINTANERSIDSTYKVIIVDECHAITSAGWQAFLKCIEEPPEFTIFIFCTTNPEKIPATILNRVMRLNFSKVDTNLIKQRLEYIANQEHFVNYSEACDFIAKISSGGVRDAIATLEKCANYSTDLSIENVLACLGNFSFDSMFDLTGDILNGDEGEILRKISDYYNSGNDLKLFIEQYLEFVLDLVKYCLFDDMSLLKIPTTLKQRCIGFSNIPNILDFVNTLAERILAVKNAIKYDVNSKTTVETMFIAICRELGYSE